MEINYLRCLSLSVDSNSEKEAQKTLKVQFSRLKSFAEAFNLSVKISSGRRQCDSPIYYFTYIFNIEISSVSTFGSVLELAAAINAFAHFNSFDIGQEKVSISEDEPDTFD